MDSSFEVRHLTISDLEASFKLQEVVYEDLDDDKKLFILPKTKGQMHNYITNHIAYGCFIGGELVSQLYYALLDSAGKVDTQIELLENSPSLVAQRDKIAMPKAAETHPDWRGHGCLSTVLDISFTELKSMGRNMLYTDIAFHNDDSISVFMKKGFKIIALDHPENDIELAIVFRDLDYVENCKVTVKNLECVSMFDYSLIKSKLLEGLYPAYMTKDKEYKLLESEQIDNMLSKKNIAA